MMLAMLLSTVLAQGYYTPQEAQGLFAQGNQAFARDDVATAREAFQKLADHGFGTPDVLYNLGTAALAEGDLGEAVLALERARREGADAPDVEANLALARARQLDQVVGGGGEEGFLPRLARTGAHPVWGWLFLVLWTVGFGVLVLRRLAPAARRLSTALVAASALALAVPVGLFYAAHAYAEATVHEAVVMAKSLPAREAPEPNAKVAFEVHAGLKVRVLDEVGEFVRIRLPNGLEGWTDRGSVALT